VDRKLILWSIALFFGCSILFRAIDEAASESAKGVSVAIQAAVGVAIIIAIIVIVKRRK